MSVTHSVAEILRKRVTLEVEGIDRMYLNAYVPMLQTGGGIATFFRRRGHSFASSSLMEPVTKAFIASIEAYARQNKIPLITFERKQRKDDIAHEYLAKFKAKEGVLFVGKAQEKTTVFRTENRKNPETGRSYAWLVRSTAMVNHYYFYAVDEDFGPFFLKFGSYFPYTARLCINGHEYVKRQLTKEGVAYEPLDNGLLSCADPKRLQQLCDELSAEKIEVFFRKWLRLLPHPFSSEDRQAGFRYELSILQAEFSLTQVLDRPVTGRILFEEIIRENLDIGRPNQVQLIFDRRILKNTPGRFRTRVITEGVIPSLHVDYKQTRVKQYHKEGRALRTETTINHTPDFGIGKRLKNLPALRQIGFQANRRLLDVQRISHDCALGEDAFQQIDKPIHVDGQRASALRFSDSRVQALLSVLVLFFLQPNGFSNRDLRGPLATMLGIQLSLMTQGRMSYDLRRLRLHGIIERIPNTHRYKLTSFGLPAALFYTRIYSRLLRPGLSRITPVAPAANSSLREAFDKLTHAIGHACDEVKFAA